MSPDKRDCQIRVIEALDDLAQWPGGAFPVGAMGHCALSIRRAETGNKVMLMQPSDYLLDNFVAHKMSFLTECRAPELSMKTWLNVFILNSANQARLDDKHYAYAFNMIRRAEGAFFSYREAGGFLPRGFSDACLRASPRACAWQASENP